MRRILLCLILILASCSSHKAETKLIGASALETRFTLIDGSYHSLIELADRPILIMFWNSECPHCRSIIPQANQRFKALMQKKQAWVLAINLESAQKLNEVQDYIAQVNFDGALHGFSGNETLDETFETFQGDGTPYFVVIDKTGKVRYAENDYEDAMSVLLEYS